MAALVQGDLVITTASIVANAPHRTRPIMGIVESTAPWVVDWANGLSTSYVAVGSGGTSVLFAVNPTPTHTSLVGKVVQIVGGLLSPGGRTRGPVVQHFDTVDPAGGSPAELVIVKTPIGFLSAAYSQVEVVPSV